MFHVTWVCVDTTVLCCAGHNVDKNSLLYRKTEWRRQKGENGDEEFNSRLVALPCARLMVLSLLISSFCSKEKNYTHTLHWISCTEILPLKAICCEFATYTINKARAGRGSKNPSVESGFILSINLLKLKTVTVLKWSKKCDPSNTSSFPLKETCSRMILF